MPSAHKSKLKAIREVKENTFIFEKENALTAQQCEHMIKQFESHEDEQYLGRVGQQATEDTSIKKSTDYGRQW